MLSIIHYNLFFFLDRQKFFKTTYCFNNLECKIISLDHSAEGILENQMLASEFGGNISTRNVNGNLVPNSAIYKITAQLSAKDFPIKQQALGILRLEADRKNIIERFWRWAISVVIRESGM